MEQEINIGISNRHVHLTKETYELLFDDEMHVERNLSQKGQFVSDKMVTLIANGYVKENVKVLGPFRNYNQVEISHHDALLFKLNPPVRASGDLDGAEMITLKTAKNEITIPACIIAQRHVHISPEEAQKYHLMDKQSVFIKLKGQKRGMVEAFIKITNDAVLEAHLDTDDANAFLLNNGDKGIMLI